MKEELIKFVMERAEQEYSDDFPISKIPEWIIQFFDQYQPERSKREDWQSDIINATSKVMRQWEDSVIEQMRCSEHCGNAVSWVQ